MNEAETITIIDCFNNKRIFKVVDYIPGNYAVWGLGNDMPAGYLPLCKLAENQPFKGACVVDTETLLTIKTDLETVKLLGRLSLFGAGNVSELKQMIHRYERLIKKYPGATNKNKFRESRLKMLRKALPIMESLYRVGVEL